MKLHGIILALLCVAVYAAAENYRCPDPLLEARLRRDIDAQNSITANAVHREVPQPSIDANINKYLLNDGRISVDLNGNANVGSEFEPRSNGQLNILHQIGENDFLHAYGNLEPNTDSDSSRNFELNDVFRFRRQTDKNKNPINFQRPQIGPQSSNGPKPQHNWDINFNRNIVNNDRTRVDVFGRVNKEQGERTQAHLGIQAERNLGRNGGFINGFGQIQSSHGSHRVSPSFGVTGGFRFRREADPQNTINFQGTQPLSGPNRQPTWDLNFNRNIANNDRTTADVFGGVSKVPGQRAQPHIGIQAERTFGNNGFIRGSGQLQPGRGGHGVSPSFGVTGGFRFRREADPQNSINFQGTQPLSGPNRQPTWDLNFNRNIANNGRTTADVFGGVSKVPGQRAQPHIGIQAERTFGNNGFIRGSGQLQPGRGGHGVSPSFGVTGGFRFRREADPQNSINFQGTQPLSGPNRQPTWDLNFNRNIANNDRTTADVFGGVSKVPGQRAQPHIGIQAERTFGNNGFIRGSGQLQPGRGGHGVSPSFGITGGFRFRREAEPQFS